MKKILLIAVFPLFLSGCSFDRLFSMLARSDIEVASDEVTERSDEVVESQGTFMEEKKAEYDEHILLTDVTGKSSFGTAYRNNYSEDGGFEHFVIAVLPLPEASFYEGWLVNPETKDFISTGKMTVTEDKEGFVLDFLAEEDLTSYSKVVITLETKDDNIPEEHVLEGIFD